MTTDCSRAAASCRPTQMFQSTASTNTPQPQSMRSDQQDGELHDTAAANAAYQAALATIANIRHTSLADFLK
jgi:hypothetical protein